MITYTKLTWWTYPASKGNWKFSRQILKYLLHLETGNLQLEQTKFPVFPCVFAKFLKVFSLTIFPVFALQWVPCINQIHGLYCLYTSCWETISRIFKHTRKTYKYVINVFIVLGQQNWEYDIFDMQITELL